MSEQCVMPGFSVDSYSCPITSMSTDEVAGYLYENLSTSDKQIFDEAVRALPANVLYACKASDQTPRGCLIGRILPNFDKNFSKASGNEVFRFFAEHSTGNLFNEKRLSFLNDSSRRSEFYTLVTTLSQRMLSKFFPYLEGYTSNFDVMSLSPFINVWPMSIEGGVDGDTFKGTVYLGGETCDPLNLSLRFSGIDTPESKVVGKFTPQLTALVNKFVDEYGLKENDRSFLSSILKKRMLYLGKLAAFVSNEFLSFANQQEQGEQSIFALEESIIRYVNPEDPMCNMPEVYDFYGRMLGTITVTDPKIISDFILNKLPEIMASQEALALYNEMSLSIEERIWLDDLADRRGIVGDVVNFAFGSSTKDPATLALMLDPSSLEKPTEMFSKEKCKKINSDWLINSKPLGRELDFNASLAMIGVAWVYPKYRNHNTSKYMQIRSAALEESNALWGDPIFRILDPVENGLDKSRNVFVKPVFPYDCMTSPK